MAFYSWSEQGELLNAFHSAIQQGTHGLIHELLIDYLDDDCVVIRGVAHSYWGVQLAIHATSQYVGSRRPFPKTQLVLNIDGRRLDLVIHGGIYDDAVDSLSTCGVSRLHQLACCVCE